MFMTGKLIKTLAVASLVIGAAGCSNDEEMRAQIQEAMSAAESAQSTANSAMTTAKAADQKATSAQQTADQAIQGVQQAKECCRANSQRIERAFERSNYK
jgi:uncharacterized lipoprotein NlpE involved in copper resistance